MNILTVSTCSELAKHNREYVHHASVATTLSVKKIVNAFQMHLTWSFSDFADVIVKNG